MVLGCGHFFTAETLDGLMGMQEVYLVDGYGEFIRLKDVSAELAQPIPRCPDGQRPVRQHVTLRYDRMINRAIIDGMSKRFFVNGQDELRLLERQTKELEQTSESPTEIVNLICLLQIGISIMTSTQAEATQIQNMFKGNPIPPQEVR